MRKTILYALAAVACTACGDKGDGSDISRFRTVNINEKYEQTLPDSLKFGRDAYYASLKVYMCWPEEINGKVPQELQSAIADKAFGEDMETPDVEKLVESLKADPIGYDAADGVVQKPVDAIPEGQGMNVSSLDVSVYPSYMSASIITYVAYSYLYPAGAAHGVGNEYYINYDIAADKVITIGQLFADMEGVKSTIDRELSKKQQYEGFLLVESVPDPENFRIDGYTITFVFNPYEVAAYAVGVVTVDIPVYELSDYMTDYARSLFGIDQYEE